MTGHWGRAALGAAGALALLGGVVALVHPTAVLAALADADPATFALGLVSVCVALACWSEGALTLLRAADAPMARSRSFVAYAAGTFGRQVLPMGNAGGPALLAYALSRSGAHAYDRTLAVVTLAELCNLLATLVLAAVGVVSLLALGATAPAVRALGVVLLALVGGLVAFAYCFVARRRLVERGVGALARLLDRTLGRRVPRVGRLVAPERVAAGLRGFYDTVDAVGRDPSALVRAFALGLVARVCFTLPLYTAARSLGAHVSIAVALFAVSAASVAAVVPLPGGVGGVELVLVGLLSALTGLDATMSLATVVLYRFCSYWFLLVATGVVSLFADVRVRSLPTAADLREVD